MEVDPKAHRKSERHGFRPVAKNRQRGELSHTKLPLNAKIGKIYS